MTERQEQEIELLKSVYPTLTTQQEGDDVWVRLDAFDVPSGWSSTAVDVAFKIPSSPGQGPYGFWVTPDLKREGPNTNYTYPTATPWGDEWGQFSWQATEWVPHVELEKGPNMLTYVRSFRERLEEGP